MKKRILTITCAASLLFCAGCGEKTSVIPENTEIQANLWDNNYTVSISTEDIDGTVLSAISGDQSLSVLRFKSAEDCDKYYLKMQESNSDAQVYSFSNDPQFGNLIIVGTKDALKAAGIKIVKVKVKE